MTKLIRIKSLSPSIYPWEKQFRYSQMVKTILINDCTSLNPNRQASIFLFFFKERKRLHLHIAKRDTNDIGSSGWSHPISYLRTQVWSLALWLCFNVFFLGLRYNNPMSKSEKEKKVDLIMNTSSDYHSWILG